MPVQARHYRLVDAFLALVFGDDDAPDVNDPRRTDGLLFSLFFFSAHANTAANEAAIYHH